MLSPAGEQLNQPIDYSREKQNVRYVNNVSRPPDLTRKEHLLTEIVDYFADRPLAGLTFRTLALGLGVSTYSLVYHFGTREHLLSEIVRAVAEQQVAAQEHLDGQPPSVDQFFTRVCAIFDWQFEPKHIKLQRLEFEGAMIETLDREHHTYTRGIYAHWLEVIEQLLINLGIGEGDASTEARILTNLFYGFRYDLVLNDDPVTIKHSFTLALERYRDHLTSLVARSVGAASA